MPTSIRRYFLGISRSGELLEDPKAFAINEELISNAANMALDDDREQPFWRQRGDRTLDAVGVSFYSGGSKAITKDGWWLDAKAEATYDDASNSVLASAGSGMSGMVKNGWYIAAAGMVIFFACLFFMNWQNGQKAEDQAAQEAAHSQQAAPVRLFKFTIVNLKTGEVGAAGSAQLQDPIKEGT